MQTLKTRKQYAIHPGIIHSSNDGDEHYIPFERLRMLWGVPRGRCILWDDKRYETFAGRRWKDYIHLTPRYDGNYVLDDLGFPPDGFGGYHINAVGRMPTSWEQLASIMGWRIRQRNKPGQPRHPIDLGFDWDGINVFPE